MFVRIKIYLPKVWEPKIRIFNKQLLTHHFPWDLPLTKWHYLSRTKLKDKFKSCMVATKSIYLKNRNQRAILCII